MTRQIPFEAQKSTIRTPSGPADFNGVRNQVEVCERPHHHRRQIHIAPETQSPDGDTEPSPEEFDEQGGVHKDGANPDAFNIIEYNPTAHLDPNWTRKRARDQSKKHQPKTLSRFISFIDNLPESEIWKNWVSALDEIQRKEYLEALVQNCGSGTSNFASLGTAKELADVSSKPTDISILSQYASFMVSFGTLNQQLACFQNLVFVSLCAVALEKTENKDGVHAVMREVLGSDASSKQLVKLVRGAKWANSLVSLLSKTKWASRSWDILCRPVSFYARLNDCSVDPKEVLERMGTNVHESLFLPESIHSPAPFAIPLVVERVFKNSTSLKVICECLGYELSSVDSYGAAFNNALEYRNTKKRPASTRCKPSKRHRQGHSSSTPDHDGQSAQYHCSRVANISASGSPLSEVHDNNTSRSTAQPQSPFQPTQADITSEEAAFGTGFLVCAREVTALDYEHTSLDGNPQSTHLHSLANGSVIREDVPLEPQSTFNTPDRLEVSNLIDFHADAAPIPAQVSIDTLLDRHASGVGNFIDLHADAAPIPAQDSINTLLDRHASGVGNFIDLHADAAPIPAQDSIDTLLDRHASGVGNFIDFHADANPIVTRPSLGIPPSTFTTPDRPSMTFNLFDATSGEAGDRSVGLSTECPNQTHPEGLANMSSSLSSEWVPLDDTLSPRSIIQTIHVVPNG
ncbi:unnamed protein product [Penicillium nalgiovense]|nr:unnamed protein product [Penicillium nalgiovense]CAG8140815.1 unnamed protein product [Penicillium nalgiovense]CAG8158011.1 unnamed protein product [Penicillium nalgiovense]CAG8172229.1 unnamed protein product [Penicillium nalgiovense]CAG8173434.1 unnamed protein product [Penicillium nalgiovense]